MAKKFISAKERLARKRDERLNSLARQDCKDLLKKILKRLKHKK